MRFQKVALGCGLWFLFSFLAQADDVQRAVWVNEAIIQTYTYSYQNLIEQQKHIATYFTVEAWMAYTKALMDAKLLDSVQKNKYFVSAVALMPPTITNTSPTSWHAEMPILVVYKNPQYQQKQNLSVTINFSVAPSGKGVRGYSIHSVSTKVISPPCVCQP